VPCFGAVGHVDDGAVSLVVDTSQIRQTHWAHRTDATRALNHLATLQCATVQVAACACNNVPFARNKQERLTVFALAERSEEK
jgi:hypothetical protein